MQKLRFFISYRRQDEPAITEKIYEAFADYYGVDNVFLDKHSLPVGTRWQEKIEEQVVNCTVMLVVIGPAWLDLLEAKKSEPEIDMVRYEIERAFHHGKVIAPIHINGCAAIDKGKLPAELAKLTSYQAAFWHPSVNIVDQCIDLMIDFEAELLGRLAEDHSTLDATPNGEVLEEVEIVTDLSIADVGRIRLLLANLGSLSIKKVRIVDVKQGSTIVTFEMPKDVAEKLLKLAEEQPELFERIQGVTVRVGERVINLQDFAKPIKSLEKTVFISYRRTNKYTALAIYQHLSAHGYDVFFDYESIPSGDFEQIIGSSIESRAHFLLILTPSALERCQEPQDMVRREIEHALRTKRNIVPLVFEKFSFDEMRKHLPEHIGEPLSKYNALEVPSSLTFFEYAMQLLRESFLNVPLDLVPHAPLPATTYYKDEQQQHAAAQSAVTEKQLSAEEYFERGNKQYDLSNWEAAIADYTEAIRLVPNFADAYNNRGNLHIAKGDYDAAIHDYERALALDPGFDEVRENLERARNALNDNS